MSRISLIVPATRDEPFRNGELATYQRLLMERSRRSRSSSPIGRRPTGFPSPSTR